MIHTSCFLHQSNLPLFLPCPWGIESCLSDDNISPSFYPLFRSFAPLISLLSPSASLLLYLSPLPSISLSSPCPSRVLVPLSPSPFLISSLLWRPQLLILSYMHFTVRVNSIKGIEPICSTTTPPLCVCLCVRVCSSSFVITWDTSVHCNEMKYFFGSRRRCRVHCAMSKESVTEQERVEGVSIEGGGWYINPVVLQPAGKSCSETCRSGPGWSGTVCQMEAEGTGCDWDGRRVL